MRSARLTAATRTLGELWSRGGVERAELHVLDHLWLVEWTDGPTLDGMRELVTGLIGEHVDAAGVDVAFSRDTTARAWAARAIASLRDGRLSEAAVLPGTPLHPIGHGPADLTATTMALMAYVHLLIDGTPYPDRADLPSDQPQIERLLRTTGGNRALMAIQVLQRLPHLGGTSDAVVRHDELAARRRLRARRTA
jgi:hypothetical protein